ncbi:hypothetical protein DERF_002749 [Dermatophagoides farinae]|uniref:Uncharacterized protein n=1 Tax=Dermatophagoides farinae TaxID=6954 RepID=A0A922LAX2_DERFA|nr:hypothetical protein DERF_002749 [Dermatophagoides farinae]
MQQQELQRQFHIQQQELQQQFDIQLQQQHRRYQRPYRNRRQQSRPLMHDDNCKNTRTNQYNDAECQPLKDDAKILYKARMTIIKGAQNACTMGTIYMMLMMTI